MIAAHRLSKKFGKSVAVDAVDFEISRGRVVGFLGPNGAGKTTTLRMICGYLRPTSGGVRVDGIDVLRDPRGAQRRLGYLPEAAALYPEMRVEEYLAFRGRIFGVPRRRLREAISAAVDRCGLEGARRKLIGHLSKGYRQRVGLASVLLHDPPILILDEPTSGLDPAQIREVRQLIRDLAGARTVLLSTHNLTEVELTCDELIMLSHGRVRARGTIEELAGRSPGGDRYVVETSAGAAAEALRKVPGVGRVEEAPAADGYRRLSIAARPGAGDLREAIARALAGRPGTTRELGREAPSLERMFLSLLEADEPGAGAGP